MKCNKYVGEECSSQYGSVYSDTDIQTLKKQFGEFLGSKQVSQSAIKWSLTTDVKLQFLEQLHTEKL